MRLAARTELRLSSVTQAVSVPRRPGPPPAPGRSPPSPRCKEGILEEGQRAPFRPRAESWGRHFKLKTDESAEALATCVGHQNK